MLKVLIPVVGLAATAFFIAGPATGAIRAVPIPVSRVDVPATSQPQTAILAGGCFWTIEAVFEQIKGVRAITVGYTGGTKADATYDKVSSETTNHAESVRIVYDPRQVSYATLLRVFFSIAHNPTELNRQGPDTGRSYRSAIFPQSPQQAAVARAYIAQLGAAKVFPAPIVTKIETGTFYPAEAYHQHFYDRNPTYPYVVQWDKPRVAAFRAAYPALVKPS